MKRDPLKDYYEARTSLLRLSRRAEKLTEEVKQAKFDLRSRSQAVTEYGSTVRAFLDGFSGKKEEKTEALRREVRRAEAVLDTLLLEKQKLEDEIVRIQSELAQMGDVSQLRTGAEKEWAELECRFCAEALEPLLEENRKALLDYRSLMRGERPEILSEWTQQEIYAQPNVCAERCIPYLQRLTEAMEILERPFDMGDYYRAPEAYLVAVAAKHSRLDRVSNALNQVERMQKLVKEYL